MDRTAAVGLDVSLHAANDLRRSLDSSRSMSTCSSGSNRTWPRNSFSSRSRKNKSKTFENNRFLKSSSKRGKSCTLHSHGTGADICPFDGSKYLLSAFSKASIELRLNPGFQTFSVPSNDDDNEDDTMNEMELNSGLWRSVSSDYRDSSSFDKMSSCRYADEDIPKHRPSFTPYRKIGSGGRNDPSSISRPSGGQERRNTSADNSIATFRKDMEAKYANYREEYLVNSPTEELRTLNVAILNARKWLRTRNDTIKTLHNSDSNKVQQDSSVVRKLITEAKVQQEGVDILLDRGQRFLAHRANIVLEVDLENLVFLWNSYVEDLRKFHDSFVKQTDGKGSSASNLEAEYLLSSCAEKSSLCDSRVNDFQEYDGTILSNDLCLKLKEPTLAQVGDRNAQSSSENVSCVDSGDLTLADLTTVDPPLDILDLSTAACNKNSPPYLESSNSFSKQNDDSEQKFDNNVVVTDTQASNFESEKMEMEVAEKMSSELGATPDKEDLSNHQSASSPNGSLEALANFDKSYNQVLECISLGSPTEPKRRRKLLDTPSSVSSISSRSGSPISLKDSGSATPTGTLTHGDRQNDLWRAIGNIDNFLMDKDILDACKSTENDLSGTDEDCQGAPSVSFAEFLQQYKELIDWLNQVQVVQRDVTSLSEKYLNQSYHEEMLERSPRREFLNAYSLQVLLRYPGMSEQISARMNRLNAQWTAVEEAIAPKHGKHDEDSMLQDLECDLNNLRRWLNAIESRLLPLTIHADWSDSELEERLVQHQALQRDIESHNKIVNAVLKLSERLEKDSRACESDKDRDSLQLVALNLEHRWHGIWLQSLEWQCRLEEAIGRRKGIYQSSFDFSGFSLPVLDESLFNHCSEEISDQGLITLDDDSLLFIGGNRDFGLDVNDSCDFDSEVDAVLSFNDFYGSQPHNSDREFKEFDSFPSGQEDEGQDICEESLKKEESRSLGSLSRSPNSKADSPLGKRRFTDSCCEGSPAKKGPSAILSYSGELSPASPESAHGSLAVSSEDSIVWRSVSCLPDLNFSDAIPIDDLKTLKVRRSLFDRSSGDSANISETESKMGDSPPGPFPEHGAIVGNSDIESDQPALLPQVIKAEVKDIGYSSESQSNDEVETMRQQIAMEYKFPGKCELASDGPLGDKVLFPSITGRSNYYHMIHVTDVDSTDKTDNGDTTDSGPEKNQENGQKSRMDEFNIAVKDETSSNNSEDSKLPFTNKKVMSHSCSQTESPLNHLVPIHQIVQFSESDSAPESKGKKSVRYLIEHAEELVRPPTSPKRCRPLSPQKVSSSTQSLLIPSPSKQTQTDTCSTVESSCDASGEDNSDHECSKLVKGEISTGTDDAEDRTLFDSVINLGSATESSNNISLDEMKLCSFQTSPVMDTPRLRKQTGQNSHRRSKKDRPWSVVGFQDPTTSKKSDGSLPAVSASESAISTLQCQTDSDSCPSTYPIFLSSYSSTFPRDHKNSKRRTVSLCAQTSYYNIVTATQAQDLTTTTPAIPQSISSFPPHTSLVTSDVSSGVDLTNLKHPKQRRTKRLHKQSSKESNVQRLPKYSTADSYDSADAESESDTTDEYLTACMEVCSSEADDVHNVSGSLSEHSTWDNYQMFYPTGSEDPGEELLTWEPQDDLEFDDDFQLTADKSIVKDVMTNKSKTKLKIKKQGASGEDSDSDMEDFHDILNQSELQLKLANQSLKKKRNDPMGTSLHPNPDKYSEILVTYDTNIKCLETICHLLNTEDVTEADVKRVQDLMEQWGKVYALASERHAQTTTLGELREIMSNMNGCIQEASDCLPFERFSSADELKDTIIQLKDKQARLSTQAVAVESVRSQLSEFASQHPFIWLDKYRQEVESLGKATTFMLDKVTEHVDSLENNWSVWLEYLECQQELDSWLAADRERLHGLLSQREFGSKITKRDVLKELETLQTNLSVYEHKLSVLQAMHAKLTCTSNDAAQRMLLASLADLRNQLFVVSERCKQVYKDVEDDEELTMEQCPDLGQLAIQASALHELMNSQSEKSMESTSVSPSEASPEQAVDPKVLPASKVCMSWLRSVPVQVVALVFVAGLMYALDPDILDRLTNFSLTVTPELRYINGPPTI